MYKSYKCNGCGAAVKGSHCSYCGTFFVNDKKDIVSCIKVFVSGDMNNIIFKKGGDIHEDFRISSDMCNNTYYTNSNVKLFISGDMNNISFKEVNFSIEKNSGHMNNIS